MTELRRVTSTLVDWGLFDGGKVLAVSTGRNGCRSASECKVLLLSASGAVVTDIALGDKVGSVVDAAVNTANVVVCCGIRGSGRSRKTILAFVSGSQVLKMHELPCSNNMNEERCYSVLCLRIGGRDVAVYGLGTGILFVCVHNGIECVVGKLWDFGDVSVERVARGRRPLEVLVLLHDSSVAVVTLHEANDSSLTGRLAHRMQLSSTAVPTQAVFSGGSVLWVRCDDDSLYGYWFSPPVNGEEVAPVKFHGEQLSLPDGLESSERVFMAGEHRSCGVHIVLQAPTAVYFRALAVHCFNGPSQPPSPVAGWSQSTLLWSGYIHSFSFKQCAYELLVQNELGTSSLSVMTLRQNSSLLKFEGSQHRPLSHQVVGAAPEELAGMREKCDLCVQELELMAAEVCDQDATEKALFKLLELQHSLVAILHRERELIKNILPYQSVSVYFIERLRTVYIRLLVYRLLYCTGFGVSLDVPLREALGLERARRASAECQADLRNQIEQELDLTSASMMETLSLWGSKDTAPSMCIDVILSHIGCSDMCSLRSVIQQMTTMKPVVALLVLYCTYAGQHQKQEEQQRRNEEEGDETSAMLYQSPQLDSLRGEFLDSFSLPPLMFIWAQLSFVADHRLNAADISATHGLGCPPLLDLIPGIINGLTYSGAYETVFQLTALVLTVSTAKDMDTSVTVKLLFLAYKRGNAMVLDALYRRTRGTVCGTMATQALALAALQTRSVKLLSGLIAPQSTEEDTVECVLGRCSDAGKSDFLLLEFYILMQRYADALKICDRIASHHSVEAQQVQIIASHLRSLMPNGNASYRLHHTIENGEHVQMPCVESQYSYNCHRPQLLRSTISSSSFPSFDVSMSALKSEEQEIDEAAVRTTARICAWRHEERPLGSIGGSLQREVNTMALMPTPVALLGIARDKSRQVPRCDAGSFKQEQQQNNQHSLLGPSPSVGHGSESVTAVSASVAAQPSCGIAALSPECGSLYCEAIIRRSKKPCGRKRPCEYHDRTIK